MTANPSRIDVAVTTSGTSTTAQVLTENTGTTGMSTAVMSNYTTVCTTPTIAISGCLNVSANPYIQSLYSWNVLQLTTQALNNICIATFNCSSGDSCANLTCTTWNTIPYNRKSNVIAETSPGITPDAVGNLTLVPGDTIINASWTAPTNTSIFCYNINVIDNTAGNVLIIDGSLLQSRTNVLISNLTNNHAYVVTISSRSRDAILSKPSAKTATPVPPCTQPICNFTVS
jgi:hypothetical protein